MCKSRSQTKERGQAAIGLLVVIGVIALMAVGLAVVGRAAVHRSRTQTAADAVALAAASDLAAADQLTGWYRDRGVVIEATGAVVTATTNHARATASASADRGAAGPGVAPALVAIIARAEQLVGQDRLVTRWDRWTVWTTAEAADRLRPVATDLGLCERVSIPGPAVGSDLVPFDLC